MPRTDHSSPGKDVTDIQDAGRTARILDVDFVRRTEAQVVDQVVDDLSGPRQGGWIVTPNIDILRQIVRKPEVRQLLGDEPVMVADGMPIVWASAIQRTPLPERVTGSSLIYSLCEAAGEHGWKVFLLGGATGIADRAAANLVAKYPGLRIEGWSPAFGIEATEQGRAEIRAHTRAAAPDLVFCGFGFPKQERVITSIRDVAPEAWYVGCGAALAFAAGEVRRAPGWMQRSGLEWVHRLSREPVRMFRRYIVDGIPFTLYLLAMSVRVRRHSAEPARRHDS